MPDALDIKETLAARHVKAPTPPTGATKAERRAEALAHVEAATAQTGPVPTRSKDPQFGHDVETYTLPPQAPGLGSTPNVDPRVSRYGTVTPGPPPGQILTAKDDPGNTSLTGTLTITPQPSASSPERTAPPAPPAPPRRRAG